MTYHLPVDWRTNPTSDMPATKILSEPTAPRFFGASLNVLGYREQDEWVALAMEMDLRGYGSTFSEALEELADLVQTQIEFAQFKDQPELIWKPAEPVLRRLNLPRDLLWPRVRPWSDAVSILK